jgi:putative toxin-antitoxin system antitoxin component (TIGR02293 family)
MGLTQSEMSMILNVSLRTLQRYPDFYILDADSSSKVLQLKALNERGVDIFNGQLYFNKWLKSPVRELDGQTPLSYLDTALGFHILDQILGRIEHGVFA